MRLALALLLLVPTASALIETPEGTTRELPLRPGEAHAFRVPFRTDGGDAYLKLVPTPGNVVHDGARANGTLNPPSGWRVAFAFIREDGARDEAGERVDSEPSTSVPLRRGEAATAEVTLHAPADARGRSDAHVALALRAAAAPGASSGAAQDEARALRFTLLDAPRAATPAPAAILVVAAALASASAFASRVRCRR